MTEPGSSNWGRCAVNPWQRLDNPFNLRLQRWHVLLDGLPDDLLIDQGTLTAERPPSTHAREDVA